MLESQNNKDKLKASVYKKLCNFLSDKFLRTFKDENGKEISQNEYADKCGLSSSTISKIKEPQGYNIPIATILSICMHENYPLSKFFNEFEVNCNIKF